MGTNRWLLFFFLLTSKAAAQPAGAPSPVAPAPRAAQDPADFPPEDAPLWELEARGLKRRLAAAQRQAPPESLEAVRLLAEGSETEEALRRLERILKTQAAPLPRALDPELIRALASTQIYRAFAKEQA